MVDQPERVPDPEPASDDAQARVAYLPIGLVFLVLGFSGLFNDSLRYGAMAFLPVGFVFLIVAMQGRTSDDIEDGAQRGEATAKDRVTGTDRDPDVDPDPDGDPDPGSDPGTDDATGRPPA